MTVRDTATGATAPVATLAVRRSDHDVPAFVETVVALLTQDSPPVIDLPHADHGNQILVRTTTHGGTR